MSSQHTPQVGVYLWPNSRQMIWEEVAGTASRKAHDSLSRCNAAGSSHSLGIMDVSTVIPETSRERWAWTWQASQPAHLRCLEKSCPLIRNTHFRSDASKTLHSDCVKLLRWECLQKKKREKKRSAKGKRQRWGMTMHSVWKYNKSQLWIIGSLQLFHISGVYIRVVSSKVFSNSWITVLILTQRQLWGQRQRACDGSELPWAPMLSLQPLSLPREPWEQAGYHPQVWGASPLSLLHPNTWIFNTQLTPESPPFLDSSCIRYLTTTSSLCCVTIVETYPQKTWVPGPIEKQCCSLHRAPKSPSDCFSSAKQTSRRLWATYLTELLWRAKWDHRLK